MKTTYIHIGAVKTGSSALQAFLTINNKLLKRKGFIFPNPPNINRNQPYQTTSGNAFYLYKPLREKNFNLLKDLIKKNKKYNIIYSNENLETLINFIDEELYHFLKKNSCKIICYIRRQDDYINSSINQLVKNHNRTRLIDEDILNHTRIFFNNLNNKKYLKDIIVIRPYEKEQFYGGSIFSDFLNILGLELTDEYQYPNKIVNPSFSPDVLEFRRLLNYYDTDILKNKLAMNKKLADYTIYKGFGKSFSNTYIISKNDRKRIINMFRLTNSNIAEYYLEMEDKKLFLDDINLDNDNYVDLNKITNEEIINIVGFLNKDKINKIFQKKLAHLVIDSYSKFKLNENLNGNILYSIDNLNISSLNMIENLKKDNNIKFISTGNDPFFIVDNVFSKRTFNLSIKLNVPKNTTFQVFYATKNINFGQNTVVSKNIKKGINHFLLQINSVHKIEKLRIDPGTIPGEYIIEEINIFI